MNAQQAKEIMMKRRSGYDADADQICRAVYADVQKAAARGKGYCTMPGYDKFPSMDWRLRELVEVRLRSEGYDFPFSSKEYLDGPLGSIFWE